MSIKLVYIKLVYKLLSSQCRDQTQVSSALLGILFPKCAASESVHILRTAAISFYSS